METLSDFPKLHCPFIRQTFQVDRDDFRRRGRNTGTTPLMVDKKKSTI